MASQNATLKQIAYLNFLGDRGAAWMTKTQASGAIQRAHESEEPDVIRRRMDWYRERFILHPDLYATELPNFLNSELAEALHAYVRERITRSSGRLTKAKIKSVVQRMAKDNSTWWRQSNYKAAFLESLGEAYPECCDGTASATPARKRKRKRREPNPVMMVLGLLIVLYAAYVFLKRHGFIAG